ncbi:GNAT family N-acetyltransferase [Aerococcaceae bacterium DSM 111176]|nr:GNAT family N-acetyltransferase [Aerococcaceae bacterium DSM 111176]
MQFKWATGITNPVYQDALAIRRKVFIEEQSVDESIEIDGTDDSKHHVVGYLNGQALATARITPLDDDTLKIQRVAVQQGQRGLGIGRKLMEEIESFARTNNFKRLILSAQDPVIPFYEHVDYVITNNEGYFEAGIPHHDMEKILS